MDLSKRLTNVAVIGAAGKMGSGISLLLANEMAFEQIKNNNNCILHLIDTREEALTDLIQYIQIQSKKLAEKQVVKLRKLYQERQDLVENEEMINEFVVTVLGLVRVSCQISSAQKSHMVFEGIIEKESIKVEVFQKLKEICQEQTFFFSNTSSIPIYSLEKKADLTGRIIGYHFYNPPAIQKLLELIPSKATDKNLENIASELAARLKKKVVVSQDVAGFIGNGHFIREGLYALEKLSQLEKEHDWSKSVCILNKVTQDLLMRPMGIFQLMDYVGLDVFQCIVEIMDQYIEEDFKSPMLKQMLEKKICGGQRADGSQKDGFFKYEKGKISGVVSLETAQYQEIKEEEIDNAIGKYPEQWLPWKKLLKDKDKDTKVASYFSTLKEANTLGAKTAINYVMKSKEIGLQLVKNHVAGENKDVDQVLMTGFFHAYGITTVADLS